MERGLRAPFSPHEEVSLRHVALGISKAKLLPARDVTSLVRLRLIDENDGRLILTALGRRRHEGLLRPVESPHQHEADAVSLSRSSRPLDKKPAGALPSRRHPTSFTAPGMIIRLN
jgi:hypothetical protein